MGKKLKIIKIIIKQNKMRKKKVFFILLKIEPYLP